MNELQMLMHHLLGLHTLIIFLIFLISLIVPREEIKKWTIILFFLYTNNMIWLANIINAKVENKENITV